VGWLQESWYEKLIRWDEALEAYNRKYQETPLGSPANLEAALGRFRWVLHLSVYMCVRVCVCSCVSLHEVSTKGIYRPLTDTIVSAKCVCLSVCLSTCLHARLSCFPYVCVCSLSVCLSIAPSGLVCLPPGSPEVCLSV